MRIIAGEMGGRLLKTVKRTGLCPTSDRVREALFSSLESVGVIDGAKVLDLYAGTGSLGLEALSRAAAQAVFVEADKIIAAALKVSIVELGVGARAQLVVGDVFDVLRLEFSGLRSFAPFDLVFADPPYDAHPGMLLAAKLVTSSLVGKGSYFVLESARRTPPEPYRGEALALSPVLQKDKVYGDTRLDFFRFEEEPAVGA